MSIMCSNVVHSIDWESLNEIVLVGSGSRMSACVCVHLVPVISATASSDFCVELV